MKKNNIFKSKKNILVIIILIVISSITIIGNSYHKSLVKFYDDIPTKSYDFNLVSIYPYEEVDRAELIEKLWKEEHIRDIFQRDEWIGYAFFDEYKELGMNGAVRLTGTIPGTKKIIYGEDLDADEHGIICPSIFFPDSLIRGGDTYNVNKAIDLKDKVGDYLTFKYVEKYEVSLKLVGIFDSAYDYSIPDECYVSHSTLKYLNNKYDPRLNPEEGPVYILLDDIENADFLWNYKDEYFHGYRKLSGIDYKIANEALETTKKSETIFAIIGIVLTYLIFARNIVNNYKNIGVLIISGYSKQYIRKIYYIKSVIMALISYFISLIISFIVAHNFARIFFYDQALLSLLKVNLDFKALLLALAIILGTVILSVTLALRKLKKMDICEIIYE